MNSRETGGEVRGEHCRRGDKGRVQLATQGPEILSFLLYKTGTEAPRQLPYRFDGITSAKYLQVCYVPPSVSKCAFLPGTPVSAICLQGVDDMWLNTTGSGGH